VSPFDYAKPVCGLPNLVLTRAVRQNLQPFQRVIIYALDFASNHQSMKSRLFVSNQVLTGGRRLKDDCVWRSASANGTADFAEYFRVLSTSLADGGTTGGSPRGVGLARLFMLFNVFRDGLAVNRHSGGCLAWH
jgi:hypothetical protein